MKHAEKVLHEPFFFYNDKVFVDRWNATDEEWDNLTDRQKRLTSFFELNEWIITDYNYDEETDRYEYYVEFEKHGEYLGEYLPECVLEDIDYDEYEDEDDDEEYLCPKGLTRCNTCKKWHYVEC